MFDTPPYSFDIEAKKRLFYWSFTNEIALSKKL